MYSRFFKVVHKVDACGTQEKPNCQFFTEMVSEDGCKELEQERGSLYKTFKKVKMEHIRCPLPAVFSKYFFLAQFLNYLIFF